MLWAAVILGLSVTGVFAQQTDVLPKGKYESIYIPEQNFQVGTMIYNADANKIASDFSSSGYALQTKSGATSFSSGRYDALPAYSLTSPAISLPQASDGEKLVLQLDQAFETEFQYDFVQVSVSEDGNSAAKLIYNNSGKTKRVDDYADLTAYAGKTVRLHFTINADATDAGKGWDIYNISVFKTGQTQAALKSSLRSANASRVARIEMLNVKSDNFPDEITAEFKAFDAAGNFVPGLDLSDFLLFDNNLNNLSCLKLVPDGIKQPVDVVFLVDNSGSMRTAMDKVNQNIEFLVTQLNQDFDLRVGLFRWGIDGGGNPPCPATNYSFEISNTGSGQDFWHLENSSNPSLSDFFSLVWDRNTVNGWYEPGWDALSHMANIQAGYRQNAQRVFILIGNEAVMDGTNQYDCQGNLTSQAQAIADLKREGIQTFTITANTTTSVADYKPIATATGGMWYDVNALDYSPILSAIGNVIADKYILTYCLNTDLEYVEVDDVCRPFEIQLKTTPTISDELCYTPQRMPSITRTAATKALDNVAQQQNRAITVAVDVCAPHTTIDRVVFRYKQHSQSVYTVQTLTAGTATGNGCYQYSATIPASAVQNPNVEYIFEAYFADGTMMKSPYPSSSFTSWVITVLPNLPPQISNVSVPAGQACTDITICAKIVDNTSNLVTKELHYRMQRTPSVFVSAPMMPCPSCGADYYCATIPRQAVDNDGVAYYIYAEDNFGSQGWPRKPADYYHTASTGFYSRPYDGVCDDQLG